MSDTSEKLHFQESPGLEDFPHFTLDVVSPELPCGSGWLGNCFLELGISLWKPWGLDTSKKWERIGPFRYRYIQGPSPLQQTLPALVTGREFTFRPHPVPRFSHQWPLICPNQKRIVFFVRDPRDALYSEWRRQQANGRLAEGTSFTAFLNSPYYHYPFSFRDYPLLFLRLWKNVLGGQKHLVVRFEDYKADANATLKKVIKFLGLKVSASEIQRATDLSDFSVAKKIEQERSAKHELHLQLNRAGIPFEYYQAYTPAMHDQIGPLFDPFLRWLGYESYEKGRQHSHPQQLSESELKSLLSAMDAFSAPGTERRRLSDLTGRLAADLISS